MRSVEPWFLVLLRGLAMHLLLLLAVLAALVVSEHSLAERVSDSESALAMAVVGMALVPAFAALVSGIAVHQIRCGTDRGTVVRRLRVLRSAHGALWLTVTIVVLFGLGWTRIVRFNWGLERAFLLDELLALLPVLLPLVLSWAAFYDIDRELRAGRAVGNRIGRGAQSREQYVWVHVRHYLGILLAPVVVLLAVQDAVRLLVPGVKDDYVLALFYAPAVLLLAVLFPALLRYVWETRPLEAGPLRERLERTARQAGFRAREILVWDTDGMVLNAAVTGFLPALRYVFLTDGLLARLSEEQVHAVFGHEIGHLRHRHLLLRVAAMIVPVSLWCLADQAFPGIWNRLAERLPEVALQGLGREGLAAMFLLGALTAYMVLLFGPYCRLLESQADLYGCRAVAVAAECSPVEIYVAALEQLAQAGSVDRNASTWQHGSIARRVAFLRRAAGDPAYEGRFHRLVWLASGLMLAVLLSPFVARAVQLLQ